jgi:hypothetical protein
MRRRDLLASLSVSAVFGGCLQFTEPEGTEPAGGTTGTLGRTHRDLFRIPNWNDPCSPSVTPPSDT